MNNFIDSTFVSNDGEENIRVRCWKPETAVRATVQIAHGIAEHCERYNEFCNFLCDNGFAVYINDHRGHGKSINRGKLGYFSDKDGWMKVVGDMRSVYEIADKDYPNTPHILFGHSMGSFLARTYLFTYPDDFDAAIICGTAQMPKVIISAGGSIASVISLFAADKPSKVLDSIGFGSYNNGFKPTRTKFDWLTRDEVIVDKYIDDPLCGFAASAGLFRDMMSGLGMIIKRENLAGMNKDIPVFFIAGDKDPVGENGKGVQKAYDSFIAAGMKDVEIKLYEDARHEILNEINKREVFDDILNWLMLKLHKEEK